MSTERWLPPKERAARQRAEGQASWGLGERGTVVPPFIHRLLVWGGVWSRVRPEVSPRNPRAAQPSPYGSCFPHAGGLRIAPPAKGQTTAGRGRGKAGKKQVGEEDCPSAGSSCGSRPRT